MSTRIDQHQKLAEGKGKGWGGGAPYLWQLAKRTVVKRHEFPMGKGPAQLS